MTRKYISHDVKHLHHTRRCFALGYLLADGSGRWRTFRNGRFGGDSAAFTQDVLHKYAKDQNSIVVFEALSGKMDRSAGVVRCTLSTCDPEIPSKCFNVSAAKAIRLIYRSSVKWQFELFSYILHKCNTLDDLALQNTAKNFPQIGHSYENTNAMVELGAQLECALP